MIAQVKIGLIGVMMVTATYMAVVFVDHLYVRLSGTPVEATVTAVRWENPTKRGSDAVLQVTYEDPDEGILLAELRPNVVLDRPAVRQTSGERERFVEAVIDQRIPVRLHPLYPTLAVSSESSFTGGCTRGAAPPLLFLTGTFFVLLLFQEQRDRPRDPRIEAPPADV